MRTQNKTVSFRMTGDLRNELDKVRGEKRISDIIRELLTGYIVLNSNRQN